MGLLHRLWQQWQKKSGDENGSPAEQDALFTIVPHFIDGERLTVTTTQAIDVFNPHNGQAERQLYAADAAQIDTAIASSLRAQKIWAATTPDERIKVLLTFRELLHAAAEDLAQIVMQEQGVNRDMARAEIEYALRLLDDAPQWRQRLDGHFTPRVGAHTDMLQQPEPVGIVLGIERGRLPVSAPAWLLSAALSCGNCVIFRPSVHHPSVAVFLADLLQRAALPAGVFNVLQGGRDTADMLLRAQHIDAAVFHGILPQELPAAVALAATHANLAVTTDCRAAAVIMPDADMESTAELLAREFVAGCQNGQHLSALIAVGDAALTLGAAVQRALVALRHTAAVPPTGALPSAEVFQQALCQQQALRDSGADILYTDTSLPAHGWYAGVTLADFVTPDHALLHQPHALPILPIVRAPDWAAAQAVLADNAQINSVALFGNDLHTLHHCASMLNVRQIGINTLLRRVHTRVGLAGIGGDEALSFFTRTRTIAYHW